MNSLGLISLILAIAIMSWWFVQSGVGGRGADSETPQSSYDQAIESAESVVEQIGG